MKPFRPREEATPPLAKQVTDVAVMRFEHVYEVEPTLMRDHVHQQAFANWDTLRIVDSRLDHLAWMHRHWADRVVGGQALLDAEPDSGQP